MQNNTPFEAGTKNAVIFSTTAPYRNPYQGSASRWLFVCSAGLLRSPTGATMASALGINARSCGSNPRYALVPCSANLINWADRIVFVKRSNKDEVVETFGEHPDLLNQISNKAVVLDIPDDFGYMDTQLQKEFDTQLFSKHPWTTFQGR